MNACSHVCNAGCAAAVCFPAHRGRKQLSFALGVQHANYLAPPHPWPTHHQLPSCPDLYGVLLSQLVERQLRPLQAAVSTALEQLALAARVQQAGGGGSAANDGGGNNAASAAAGGGGAAAATEAEACGDGQAIDAWLAVSRVQEVLGWVLQQAGEL